MPTKKQVTRVVFAGFSIGFACSTGLFDDPNLGDASVLVQASLRAALGNSTILPETWRGEGETPLEPAGAPSQSVSPVMDHATDAAIASAARARYQREPAEPELATSLATAAAMEIREPDEDCPMDSIPYIISHEPPRRHDEIQGQSYTASSIMFDAGGSWLAPDQTVQGNESLNFVLDFQSSFFVSGLVVHNCWDGACDHYYVGDYRISLSDDGVNFEPAAMGTFQAVGEPQTARIGKAARYLKFQCLTYGVAPGISLMYPIGSQIVKITSCMADSTNPTHKCDQAYDGIYNQANNGWKSELQEAWASFNLAGAPDIAGVGIVSGVGYAYAVTPRDPVEFVVEIKSSGRFQAVSDLSCGLCGGPDVVGVVSGNRATCQFKEVLQLSFAPATMVEALKLGVNGAGTNVNEIFVYKVPDPVTPAPTPPPTPACSSNPTGWISAGGSDCATYYWKAYCNLDGSYGAGWETAFGRFELWAIDGVSPLEACCACGGGLLAGAVLGPLTMEVVTADGPPVCTDSPPDWISRGGSNCQGYFEKAFCTASGGYGVGWEESFGTFDVWAKDQSGGGSARGACCACGGGLTEHTSIAVPKGPCVGAVPGWRSAGGSDCAEHGALRYCENGGYGEGWQESFGTFNNWAVHGVTALTACCECALLTMVLPDTPSSAEVAIATGVDTNSAVTGPCVSDRSWTSQGSSTCAMYVERSYCTTSGGYGSGWEEGFGSFEMWSAPRPAATPVDPSTGNRQSMSATQACCECGAGIRPANPASTPVQAGDSLDVDVTQLPRVVGIPASAVRNR